MSSAGIAVLIFLATAILITAFVLSILAYLEATKEVDASPTEKVDAPPTEAEGVLNTKGDLFGFSTENERLPAGSDFSVLISDSNESLGLKYSTKPIINVVDVVIATPFTMEIGTEYNFRSAAGVVAQLPLSPPFGSQVVVTDAQGDFHASMNQVQVTGSNRLFRKGSVQPGAQLEDLTINNGTYTFTYVATDRWIVDGANLPLTPRVGITEDPAPALDNSIYSVSATATAYDFTLPPATGGPSRIKLLYPVSGGFNDITIRSTGLDTINNSSSGLVMKNNSLAECISSEGNWFVQINDFTVATVGIPRPEGEYNTSIAAPLPSQTNFAEGGSYLLHEDVFPTNVAFAHTAGLGEFRVGFYQAESGNGKDASLFEKVHELLITPDSTTTPARSPWGTGPILKAGVLIVVMGRSTATECTISRYFGTAIPLINSTTNDPTTTIMVRSTSFTLDSTFTGGTTFPTLLTDVIMQVGTNHAPILRFF